MTCVAFSIKFAKTNQKFAENSEFREKNSLLLVNYSLHSLLSASLLVGSNLFFFTTDPQEFPKKFPKTDPTAKDPFPERRRQGFVIERPSGHTKKKQNDFSG